MKPFTADWRPSLERLAWARAYGFTETQLEEGIARCHDHFAATGQAYACRSAIWQSWMIANLKPANRREVARGDAA